MMRLLWHLCVCVRGTAVWMLREMLSARLMPRFGRVLVYSNWNHLPAINSASTRQPNRSSINHDRDLLFQSTRAPFCGCAFCDKDKRRQVCSFVQCVIVSVRGGGRFNYRLINVIVEHFGLDLFVYTRKVLEKRLILDLLQVSQQSVCVRRYRFG